MTQLATALGVGLILMLYVAITRHDRLVQLRERIAELEAQHDDDVRRVSHLEVQRSCFIAEATTLIGHSKRLEADNAYLRSSLAHRKQVLAGSMLQMQLTAKGRKMSILDGVAP